MHYCPEKSWYVLRVRSQAERLVHVGLHHKQFEVLNPTYQALSIRKDRRKVLTRPIFNGYMFVRTLDRKSTRLNSSHDQIGRA